ncbi:hypothetical protein ASF23_03240 [Curtobacterium sp. Leaf261]|nr:hypothetical protein ASF23_03240 [Curtobacterium sp. Leaf261]
MIGLVDDLVHAAIRQQCWLLFVAEDRRTIDLVLPITDLPEHPDDDEVDHTAETIAEVTRQLRTLFVVIAWERPGSACPSLAEWEWVHAIEGAFADAGVVIRAQLLVHDDGVAWLDVGTSDGERGAEGVVSAASGLDVRRTA